MVHIGLFGKILAGAKTIIPKAVGAIRTLAPKIINIVKKVGGTVGNFVRNGDMDKVIDKADKTWKAVKPLLPEKAQQGGERFRRGAIDITDKGRYLVSKYDQIYGTKE